MILHRFRMQLGITQSEMLIGIGVTLLLAVGALFVVNPSEILRQQRDIKRKEQIEEVGRALISYGKVKNGVYPYETVNWLSSLEAQGELEATPVFIEYDEKSAICKNNEKFGLCYDTDGKYPTLGAIAYTKLESVKENTRCNVSLSETAWFVYSTSDNRTGVVCTVGTEPLYLLDGQKFRE